MSLEEKADFYNTVTFNFSDSHLKHHHLWQ